MNDNMKRVNELKTIIDYINLDLRKKGIFNIEYLLMVNQSSDIVTDVRNILANESKIYNSLIRQNTYYEALINYYLQTVKKYYDSISIDGNKEDYYMRQTKKPINFDTPKSNINMSTEDVFNCLRMMKEAVDIYYNVYYNKVLIAELTNNDQIELRINHERLLHLLGVSTYVLRNNPDFRRISGLSDSQLHDDNAILKWILNDFDGNQDLIQYHDDFIKRLTGSFNPQILYYQNSPQTTTQLLNYAKVGVRSETFAKFGPLEKVSLVSKLKNGAKMSVSPNSNITADTAILTRNETFRNYPWAFFGFAKRRNDDYYAQTLLIDNDRNKGQIFSKKDSKPAIVKKVYIDGSHDGGGGVPMGTNIFSEEQQYELFCQACESFSDVMNFSELIDYFDELTKKYNRGGKR